MKKQMKNIYIIFISIVIIILIPLVMIVIKNSHQELNVNKIDKEKESFEVDTELIYEIEVFLNNKAYNVKGDTNDIENISRITYDIEYEKVGLELYKYMLVMFNPLGYGTWVNGGVLPSIKNLIINVNRDRGMKEITDLVTKYISDNS